MKKILCFLLIILSLFFTSCTSSNNNSNKKPNESTIANNNGIGEATVSNEDYGMDEEEVANSINVTPYMYSSSSGTSYLALVLTNTSKFDCGLNVDVTFFNKNNKKIDDSNDYITALASGASSVLTFTCYSQKFKKYKYKIEAVDISNQYAPITKNLQLSVKLNKYKDSFGRNRFTTVANVKNIGSSVIDNWVRVDALFFKKNKLVYTNYSNIYDPIKPKKTANVEISCYEKYDSVKTYINGFKYVQ